LVAYAPGEILFSKAMFGFFNAIEFRLSATDRVDIGWMQQFIFDNDFFFERFQAQCNTELIVVGSTFNRICNGLPHVEFFTLLKVMTIIEKSFHEIQLPMSVQRSRQLIILIRQFRQFNFPGRLQHGDRIAECLQFFLDVFNQTAAPFVPIKLSLYTHYLATRHIIQTTSSVKSTMGQFAHWFSLQVMVTARV
jgi:hypothetical protein